MEIRALRPEGDRSGFQCGDASLDRFFQQFAGQNQFRHYLGLTYVAVDSGRILGFVTVAPRHLNIEDLPERARRKLPRYPIPVLGLARLAVDTTVHSQGLGAQLLRFALKLAIKMSGEVGCAGVVVDAKPSAVNFCAKFGFIPMELLEGRSEGFPRPVAMWLSMQSLLAAEA